MTKKKREVTRKKLVEEDPIVVDFFDETKLLSFDERVMSSTVGKVSLGDGCSVTVPVKCEY